MAFLELLVNDIDPIAGLKDTAPPDTGKKVEVIFKYNAAKIGIRVDAPYLSQGKLPPKGKHSPFLKPHEMLLHHSHLNLGRTAANF